MSGNVCPTIRFVSPGVFEWKRRDRPDIIPINKTAATEPICSMCFRLLYLRIRCMMREYIASFSFSFKVCSFFLSTVRFFFGDMTCLFSFRGQKKTINDNFNISSVRLT